MIKELSVEKKTFRCSTEAKDFFPEDTKEQINADIALDLMRNCLDTIYELVSKYYPTATKPELYLTDEAEVNAYAIANGSIIVTSKLIFDAAQLILVRYTKERLEKYHILEGLPHNTVLSHIRAYLWRYIVLHELYHIWNGHSRWKRKYSLDDGEKIVDVTSVDEEVLYESENVDQIRKSKPDIDIRRNVTQQALELDADSCAVYMLVKLLMCDAYARKVSNIREYVKYHMALMFAALATAFCMFDGNSGAKFEKLDRLSESTHPLPSIRLSYAEEIANITLSEFFSEEDELYKLETEWQKIICDIEADRDGIVDMGQAYFLTAYTEKAQRHLCALKQRLHDMYDTLSPFFLGNHPQKMCEEEMCYLPEYVWFTDDGMSIKGWINPATGKESAIKAKPQPIVKGEKIGRNDPCPCGSGLKFKKCTCDEYHKTVI